MIMTTASAYAPPGSSSVVDQLCCVFCNIEFKTMFIECVDCSRLHALSSSSSLMFTNICLACFANGLQNATHKNTHAYKVVDMRRLATFDGWSLDDELRLLESLGPVPTASSLTTSPSSSSTSRTPLLTLERLDHIGRWFDLLAATPPLAMRFSDELKLSKQHVQTTRVHLFRDDLLLCDNNDTGGGGWSASVRPALNSKHYRAMSGYRYARGDFDTEHNDKYEMEHVADMDFDTTWSAASDNLDGHELDEGASSTRQVEHELKMSVLRSYNELIRERYARKRLVRDLGILAECAAVASSSGFALAATGGGGGGDRLNRASASSVSFASSHHQQQQKQHHQRMPLNLPLKFQRLFDSYEAYAKFAELVQYRETLRRRMADLAEMRSMGVRSLKFAHVYRACKHKRATRTPTLHLASLLTALRQYQQQQQQQQHMFHQKQAKCLDWFRQFVVAERSRLPPSAIAAVIPTQSSAPSSALAPRPGGVASHEATRTIESGDTVATVAPPPPPPTTKPAPKYFVSKYKNNPLPIESYPDADKLDEEEKEFCRVARVQPAVYLRVKAVLMLENARSGSCNYSKARKIAGIDVNKTRLIHSLLLKKALINLTPLPPASSANT